MDTWKKKLAYLLAAVLLFVLAAPAAPSDTVFAATKKTAKNPITELGMEKLPEGNTLLVGDTFNFNPDIMATERGKGKTTGVVWWEVNARTNTAGVSSSRWGYVYPATEGSFAIRALAFASTKDLNAWKAARKANGNVADEDATRRYVTAATDWVTIEVVSDLEGYAVARSQYQLNFVLKDKKATDIHIKTDKVIKFTIASKNYTNRTLTVDAPNAEVENAGRFAQINIQQIKASTFTEKAYGNRFYVTAPNARLVLLNRGGTKEVVFAPKKDAKAPCLTIVGEGGRLNALNVAAAGKVELVGRLFGQAKNNAVVTNVAPEAAGTNFRTEIPLELHADADVAVTVQEAENGSEDITEPSKTVIHMEKAAKVSVDGTAAGGTTVVVKGDAKGSVVASDAALVIIADADVTLELSGDAAGTTVTKGENAKVVLSGESTVEGVTVTDPNGKVENIKPGEDSPEVTIMPSAAPTPSAVPTTTPSGGSSGWTPSYPSNTPIPTSTPAPSGIHYSVDGGKAQAVSFGEGSKEAIIALPADSVSGTLVLNGNGTSAQKVLAAGINTVSAGEYTVKFVVPLPAVEIAASLLNVETSSETVTGSAVLAVRVKDDLSAFTSDADFTVSYEWRTGDTVIADASGAVYQKAVEVAVDGNVVTYAEEGAYLVIVKVSHSKTGEVLAMQSGMLKIDFRVQAGEEAEITPIPTPTPDVTPTPNPDDPDATPTPGGTPDDKPENDHVMDWKDAALEAAMRKVTGIYDREIMLSDVWNLTELTLLGGGIYSDHGVTCDENITNIEALAELTNLTNLILDGHGITDISALAGMPELLNIQLSYNKVSDISVLASMPKLISVGLRGNNISDISALKDVKNLYYLSVSENPIDLQMLSDVLSGRTGLRGLQIANLGITDLDALMEMADLTGLESLELSRNQIGNLEALAKMPNLKYLDLSECGIKDISALKGLSKLETLNLGGNQITDITALSGMTGLQNLYLSSNQITDITALSGMTGLQDLDFGYNQIAEIIALSEMKELKMLNLNGNQIAEITALSGMRELKMLNLNGNRIAEITALSEMTELERLNLNENQIADITALSKMAGLKSLSLRNNQITSVTALSGKLVLETLELAGNQIADITALSGMTGLNELELDHNQITDITVLSGMAGLQRLGLGNNQIADIAVLSEMTGLQNLDIDGNQITDITVLSKMTGLQSLSLGNNQITDITALSGMTKIETLYLSDNQIADITALSGMTGLRGLYLSGNQITNITVLSEMAGLQYLALGDNQITDITALSGMLNLETLGLYNNQITDVTALSGLKNLKSLSLFGNQITDYTPVEFVPELSK